MTVMCYLQGLKRIDVAEVGYSSVLLLLLRLLLGSSM
jgi:hypothetical protein